MESLISIFEKWEPFGQAVFILIIFFAILGSIGAGFRYIAVIFRGWPPPSTIIQSDDDEDEDEE